MADGVSVTRIQRTRVRLVRLLVNALFGLLTKRTVTGLENIPASGPCLLVFNHLSNFDPPLIFGQFKRFDVLGLVASEYRSNRFYRSAIEWAGGRWIHRGASDREALKYAIAALNDGWIVGIAPEGGRSKNGGLRAGKPGTAALSMHSGAPILPVGLTGTEHIAHGLKHLRRVPLTVSFGPVFWLFPTSSGNHKRDLEERTDEIMCHVAALIPPQYRGVYTDHLRLHYLLQPWELETGTYR